jgi:type 1 fimbria pilin
LNKGKKSLIAMVSLVLLVLLSGYAGLAYGQAETGTINGTVTDSTNAVVPNAMVIVKSVNTGATRETTTNASGFYTVTSLRPDSYEVTVEAKNFQSLLRHVTLTVGSTLDV